MKRFPSALFLLFLFVLSSAFSFAGQLMTVALEKPLAFIAIVDNSGSMDWPNRDPNGIRFKGMEFAIGRLQDSEAFSYISFDTAADIVVPLTTVTGKNRDKLAEDAGIIPGDRDWTNYTEGFNKGLQIAIEAKEKGFFPVVAFLTDGEMNVSAYDTEDQRELERLLKNVIPQFLKEGVPIFTIGLGEFRKEILINISDAARFFENSDQFFEVNDSSEIPFVMNGILSVIRGEKLYQSYSIASGKTETIFEIGQNVRKMSVELTSLDQSIDVTIYDPAGNRLNLQPEKSFAFQKWIVENPSAGKWKVVIASSTSSKIEISLQQDYDIELIIDPYIGVGGSAEALVKVTRSDKSLILPGEEITIDNKKLEVKEIKGFLTVQGAGINTNVSLKWNGANLEATMPKVSKTGLLKIFGEVQIECGEKKESATVKLAIPQKTVRVISAKIVKLEFTPSKDAVRNGEVTISARGDDVALDSVEVQIIFPNGEIRAFPFVRDAGQVFKATFNPPVQGKYMIYPIPTENFVFSSSSREILVQEPYLKLKSQELIVRGAFPKRDYWVDTKLITEFYSPDNPTVNILVPGSGSFDIEISDVVAVKSGKSEIVLKILVKLENRFSSFDKIFRKNLESLVTIRDTSGTLNPSEQTIKIRVIAPLPAIESAIAAVLIAFVFLIPALARKRKQISIGRLLKLDTINETTFGRASDVRYRFEQSNFPLHGFTVFYTNSETGEDSYSAGGEWMIKSDDAAGSIFVDEYPLAIGESVKLNDGSRIAVRKGRKNLFAFSFETREPDQSVLRVRSTKYRVNKAAVVRSLFSLVCVLMILWWSIIQKFGI
ncbi:MAG: hypothetical protein GXX80_14735 [Thermotogaceae bacterium]|nr:hypothetical protein [Thermotogaceae bacterium]